jgi:hypothetical protein
VVESGAANQRAGAKSTGMGGGRSYGLLGVPREAAVDVDGEGGGEVERGDAQPSRQRLERQVAHRHRAASCPGSGWSSSKTLALGMGISVTVLSRREKASSTASPAWEGAGPAGGLLWWDGGGLDLCSSFLDKGPREDSEPVT